MKILCNMSTSRIVLGILLCKFLLASHFENNLLCFLFSSRMTQRGSEDHVINSAIEFGFH